MSQPTDPSLSAQHGSVEIRLLGGFSVHLSGALIPDDRWSSLRAGHLVQLLAID